MAGTITVTRAQVAAAKLKIKRAEAAGRPVGDAVQAIARARPLAAATRPVAGRRRRTTD
jgi:hypothetical protein